MRIKDRDRAKLAILEIIRQAGGRFQNKTNLFKAFWKAHLEYARRDQGYLTGWPIVRMPQGPGIDRFDMLLGELLRDGLVHVEQVQQGGVSAFVFMATSAAETASEGIFGQPELDAIRAGVEFVQDRTAAAVSSDSHEQSRSWRMANDGEELNLYLDLIPDEESGQDAERLESLAAAARELWGSPR